MLIYVEGGLSTKLVFSVCLLCREVSPATLLDPKRSSGDRHLRLHSTPRTGGRSALRRRPRRNTAGSVWGQSGSSSPPRWTKHLAGGESTTGGWDSPNRNQMHTYYSLCANICTQLIWILHKSFRGFQTCRLCNSSSITGVLRTFHCDAQVAIRLHSVCCTVSVSVHVCIRYWTLDNSAEKNVIKKK